MNVSPYYEQAIRSYSAEDKAFYDKATGFLPVRKETMPYHSGPHSVRSLRMAYELAGEPEDVLEVGFCLGHSTALFFELGATSVSSIEPSTRPETLEAAKRVKKKFPKDFDFIQSTATELLVMDRFPSTIVYHPEAVLEFGLIFIDGDHGVEAVEADVRLALKLEIPFILFDDYFLHWSEGTQPAIEKYKLIPLAILGTMCLCRPPYDL